MENGKINVCFNTFIVLDTLSILHYLAVFSVLFMYVTVDVVVSVLFRLRTSILTIKLIQLIEFVISHLFVTSQTA